MFSCSLPLLPANEHEAGGEGGGVQGDICRNQQEPFCLIWEGIIRHDMPTFPGGLRGGEGSAGRATLIPIPLLTNFGCCCAPECTQPCSHAAGESASMQTRTATARRTTCTCPHVQHERENET